MIDKTIQEKFGFIDQNIYHGVAFPSNSSILLISRKELTIYIMDCDSSGHMLEDKYMIFFMKQGLNSMITIAKEFLENATKEEFEFFLNFNIKEIYGTAII